MPTYTWRNILTDEYVEIRHTIADRDTPPDEEGEWERVMEMPAVKRVSYLEGQRSKSDKGYAAMKQAAHLEVQKASSSSKTERAEIQKAITKLTTV